MDSRAQLKSWFVGNGGLIDDSISIVYDEQSGQHIRATSNITASEDSVKALSKCPFSLTLSCLNILDSPPAGIRNCSSESVCIHLVDKVPKAVQSYFFLCEQKLLGEKSFWAPYIATLPKEGEMTTPWWFSEEDLVWLLGTGIHVSPEPERSGVEMRRGMWKQHWQEGSSLLKDAGVPDVERYTWELYLWAATIFSSRSFTSHILTSATPGAASTEPFALLYPVIDSFNHRFGAKVLWKMDEGNFELNTAEPATSGEQVFNNYAPKGNEEFLNGYGFCIPDNPCDEVALRIGKPPGPVFSLLREQYPQRFNSAKWTDDAAMFFLRGSGHYTGGYAHKEEEAHLRGIPPELLGTLRAILAHSYKQQGEELKEEHLDPAAVDAIVERLVAKYQGIRQHDERLPEEPQNEKQRAAKIYRDGQLEILVEIIGELQEYLEQF